MKTFLKAAAQVKPSQRQLDWYDMEFYAFIHLGVNTFTDREWGTGEEPESIFNPTELDCDQWVESAKLAGMKGLVLTAKHHDGFCLWPSRYTEHSVKNSPVKRDVVKEAAEACKRGGIKFGFYLSPWDRNSELYGTDAYNDYFCNQLTELLTEYGEIAYVWFDGACGEGPNGKKQQYDFPRYMELIRKLQPNACIFSDYGPDVRWCGNEAGSARYAEWAVVPGDLCCYGEVQTGAGPMADEGDLTHLYNTNTGIGSLSNIMYAKGLTFVPSEVDMSIRPGWFWHEEEEPHSLERLFRTYLTSVGGNACFHLNLPPNRLGKIDERDVKRLKEFGELLKRELGTEIPAVIRQVESSSPTQKTYEITFDNPESEIRYIVLREDIAQGQRVESFQIEPAAPDGYKNLLYQGTTIGNRRICKLRDPFEDQNPLTKLEPIKMDKLIIRITAARDSVCLKEIKAY